LNPINPEGIVCGLSLREQHFPEFLARKNRHKAFEIIFENFLFTEGERRDLLRDISPGQLVHLHGVTTNIGSADPLNLQKIRNLRALSDDLKAGLVSDHLCFTRMNGVSSFELLPLPRTHQMVAHVGERLKLLRDELGRDFLLENISGYFEYDVNEMTEMEFLGELHEKFQARFVFDVNNFFVNARNFSFSAETEIRKLRPSMVGAYHLGGHEDFGSFLFDTHGRPVEAGVWDLFQTAVRVAGARPTFLERDENIPGDIGELEKELDQAVALLGGAR
jgi:uncharacterized protein (UPF0276 family)